MSAVYGLEIFERWYWYPSLALFLLPHLFKADLLTFSFFSPFYSWSRFQRVNILFFQALWAHEFFFCQRSRRIRRWRSSRGGGGRSPRDRLERRSRGGGLGAEVPGGTISRPFWPFSFSWSKMQDSAKLFEPGRPGRR